MAQKSKARGVKRDPAILSGQPCIAGTRIPVYLVLGMLSGGDTAEAIAGAFPSITAADVRACLQYAADVIEKGGEPVTAAPRGVRGGARPPAARAPSPRARPNSAALRASSSRA